MPSILAATTIWGAGAEAGHKHKSVTLAPVLVQQSPPTTQVFAAPTTQQVYSAPTITQVYSAPTSQVYSAPTSQVYSAPAQTSVLASSNGGVATIVGNAPVAGAKIDAVDRDDIISELRKEAKEGSDGTSMRERRKTLRESARTKYAESIGVEASELGEADEQDITAVVNAILSPNSSFIQGGKAFSAPTTATTAFLTSAPATTATFVNYVPAFSAPQPTMFVQPLTPVLLYVPVQQKHHWLHK